MQIYVDGCWLILSNHSIFCSVTEPSWTLSKKFINYDQMMLLARALMRKVGKKTTTAMEGIEGGGNGNRMTQWRNRRRRNLIQSLWRTPDSEMFPIKVRKSNFKLPSTSLKVLALVHLLLTILWKYDVKVREIQVSVSQPACSKLTTIRVRAA